jgi:hypothetical protein
MYGGIPTIPCVVGLTILLSVGVGVVAMAQPCTLYKLPDIQIARENVGRYRWARDIMRGWERAVQYTLEQDREFYEQMVPELTLWTTYGQNCPACVGRLSSMGECNIYRWTITDPDRLVCKYCETEYPSPDYPETGSMTAPSMGQTFTFYETEGQRANRDDPEKYAQQALRWASWPINTSFTGVIRAKKAKWVAAQVAPLMKLYAVTGEAEYARHLAWILDRFARCYPDWMFHSYNGTYADCPPAEAARNMGEHGRGGRFPKEIIIDPLERHQFADYATLCNGFWGADRFDCSGCSRYLLDMTVAYDLIRDATDEDGTPLLTDEMHQRITEDLILAGCNDMENWKDINNKCGPNRALSAAVGILFERPASVRRALEGFELLMERCFHFDGFCRESPSYAGMHLGLMQDIPEILRGYSDPPGYEPQDGPRLADFNPFEHVVRYRLALEAMVRKTAPANRYPILGDTHYTSGPSSRWVEVLAYRYSHDYAGLLEAVQGSPLSERGSEYALWYRDPDMRAGARARLPLYSEWFPGWHVAVLRAGAPDGHTAMYFNAYAYHGHRHHDTLGVVYHAYDKEIASDRGYIWDDPRNAWTSSTLAHNIVTVDGTNQRIQGRVSNLELFGAGPGVEVVQASSNAYDQCSRYQRTCALVQIGRGQTYNVDFFRVTGGQLHQYGFQCNGEMIDLTAPPPTPVSKEIKWLSRLRASAPEGQWKATWHHDGVNMDILMLSPIYRLLLADAPGWRSDRGSELHAPPIHQVFAERTAQAAETDELTSEYAAIMVPYKLKQSPVISARLLPLEDAAGAMAVEVRLANRTDYIVSSLDHRERRYGPLTMNGRFGFVSLAPDGSVLQAYLLDGSRLDCGAARLVLQAPSYTLPVASVEGRTFQLAEALPTDASATGACMLAADTGYEIQQASGNSITVRDYPAIECEQVTILSSVWLQMHQQ